MRVIYATGYPGELEFAVTDSRNLVPSNAIVLAICSEQHAMMIQDQDLLDEMIDQELSMLRALFGEARELEMRQMSFWKTFSHLTRSSNFVFIPARS
jgi:hypothetical protein